MKGRLELCAIVCVRKREYMCTQVGVKVLNLIYFAATPAWNAPSKIMIKKCVSCFVETDTVTDKPWNGRRYCARNKYYTLKVWQQTFDHHFKSTPSCWVSYRSLEWILKMQIYHSWFFFYYHLIHFNSKNYTLIWN